MTGLFSYLLIEGMDLNKNGRVFVQMRLKCFIIYVNVADGHIQHLHVRKAVVRAVDAVSEYGEVARELSLSRRHWTCSQ